MIANDKIQTSSEVEPPLIKIDGVSKSFVQEKGLFSSIKNKYIYAVDDVSFTMHQGETLGLIGESGCGKTTIGRILLHLLSPDRGSVEFRGKDIIPLRGPELKSIRRRINVVFQDPYESLNPRLRVEEIIAEPMLSHRMKPSLKACSEQVANLLNDVGLRPEYARRFPHEFSGGQRQRIGIARAIALNPELIVCDEPVSALDVSIQAQIMNLLLQLQAEKGIAFLFISHDLSVIRHLSDTIAVMYLGRIVESAPRDELFKSPLHPYTRSLLSAIPDFESADQDNRIVLKGEIPSPTKQYAGCSFASRCYMCHDKCLTTKPIMEEKGKNGHWVACLYT